MNASDRPTGLVHAGVVLVIEIVLTAVAWTVLHRLGQPQASFPITMAAWTCCLVLYATPVQTAIAARSRDGSLSGFLALVAVAIWAASATTHLPAMYPMVIGIAGLEIAGQDSSWRTAGVGLLTLVLGTTAMGWLVDIGRIPSIFPPAGNYHLSVILALFGSLLIVRGVGRAREADRLRDELALRHAELRHAAGHDALTGLLSRRGLGEVLAGPTGRSAGLALLYLDLDGFKAVNDQHGHDVGDALLVEVAARFAATVPEPGVLARIGGDEFVVVAPGQPSLEHATHLSDRLQDCVRAPITIGSRVMNVGVSIGVSWSPEANPDPEALLQEADQIMYERKRAAREARLWAARSVTDPPRVNRPRAGGVNPRVRSR